MQNALKTLFVSYLLIGYISPSISQEPSHAKLERQGQVAIEDGEWEKAKEVYHNLVEIDPDDPEYNLYLGLAYLNSKIDVEKSVPYLSKVYPEQVEGVYFLRGQAYHYTEQFDSAIAYYEKFKPYIKMNKNGEELTAEVDRRIMQCQNGQKLYKTPREGMNFDNLGGDVNTKGMEYAPVIYQDLQTIVFTGTNINWPESQYVGNQSKLNEDIFYSVYDPINQEWLARKSPDGTVLNANVNTDANESSVHLNKSKSNFYFLRENELWVSKNQGEPEKTEISLEPFEPKKVVALYVNDNETSRFLVADHKDGKGGLDIYMSVIDPTSDKWTKWENLENLNTPLDEDSPYLSQDGNKLYFSSQGHNSMGGHDIFVATKNEAGIFGNVKNMGVPINSPANDIHYTMTGDKEEFGYLSSDRMQSVGDMDIWRFWTCYDIKKTRIKGKLLAKGEPVEAVINLLDLDSNELSSTEPSDLDGGYTLNVETQKDYVLEVSVPNYFNQYFPLSIPKQCSEYDLYQNLELDMVTNEEGILVQQRSILNNAFFNVDELRGDQEPEQYIATLEPTDPNYSEPIIDISEIDVEAMVAAEQFDNIYFAFDKWNIDGAAEAIVDKVAVFMNDYDYFVIVIRGHTDSMGTEEYNKLLSQRRAESVAKSLQEKGLSPDRIITESYGESQLLVADTTQEGGYIKRLAAKNRRVEMEIKPKEKE